MSAFRSVFLHPVRHFVLCFSKKGFTFARGCKVRKAARQAAVAALGQRAVRQAEHAAAAVCRLRAGLEAALQALQGVSMEQDPRPCVEDLRRQLFVAKVELEESVTCRHCEAMSNAAL